MRFRFTIGSKLYTGFGVFIFASLIVFLLTNRTLDQSREINDRINKVYSPSVEQLQKLRYEIIRTRMLITNWAFVQSREDTKEKRTLIAITNEDLPEIIGHLEALSVYWTEPELRKINNIIADVDELLEMYEVVKKELPDMPSYDEDFNVFYARDYAEEGGVIDIKAHDILFDLENLILAMRKNTEQESREMLSSFDTLKSYLFNFGIMLILGGVLIALLMGRSIVKPVQELKRALVSLGRGVIPEKHVKTTNDEIGEMSDALNMLMDGFEQTTIFAEKVGQGQFNYPYKPLSEEDKLGEELLKMAQKLGDNERYLEELVKARTQEVVQKSERINELYKDVTASIRYAKRLQESILPPAESIAKMFPDHFVFYRPKDIVSGDFYYFREVAGKKLFAVVDSTGHGVPGAFMSLVGFNGLARAVKKNQASPSSNLILDSFHTIVQDILNKSQQFNTVRDSMDVGLCVYDPETRILEYSGAKIPLYMVSDGELINIAPTKKSVGELVKDNVNFEKHTIQMKPGDKVYLFSDGYVDQFGGPKGRKFMYNQLRKMILHSHTQPMENQKEEFILRLDFWMDGFEQVDDILFVGIGID